MKYFKLGLLAATISLVAIVIALDKKQRSCGICEEEKSYDDSQEEENNIIVEEDIVVEE